MVMKAQAHPGFSSSGATVAGIGSFFRRALRNWNDRRTVIALSDLDDHLLADIGLTRSDLDWALHQHSSALPSEELTRRALERRERRNRRVI
jgi:uncharacterized protein YjiS (DUF1127 family)